MGNPSASKTIVVSLKVQLALEETFDNATITMVGSFAVDKVAKTFTGSPSVTVVDSRSGDLVFSKNFSVAQSFAMSESVRFSLEIPIVPLTLAISCTVGVNSDFSKCMVSRTLDLNDNGRVDIVDVAMLATVFGLVRNSSNYDPAIDLNASGTIDIIDAAMIAAYFDVTVLS